MNEDNITRVLLSLINNGVHAHFAPKEGYHTREQVRRMLSTLNLFGTDLETELCMGPLEMDALCLACIMDATHRCAALSIANVKRILDAATCPMPYAELAVEAIMMPNSMAKKVTDGSSIKKALHDLRLAVWTQYRPQEAVGRLVFEAVQPPDKIIADMHKFYTGVCADSVGMWCTEVLYNAFSKALVIQAEQWLRQQEMGTGVTESNSDDTF